MYSLLESHLKKLEAPALLLIDKVYNLLERIAIHIVYKVFEQYLDLSHEIIEIITKYLSQEKDKVKQIVNGLLGAE